MRAIHLSLVDDLKLRKDQQLVYHFTTQGSAELIFGESSIGIRASGGGMGGAGTYVCVTPLHVLGWEQYGGNGWREKVGRALWSVDHLV